MYTYTIQISVHNIIRINVDYSQIIQNLDFLKNHGKKVWIYVSYDIVGHNNYSHLGEILVAIKIIKTKINDFCDTLKKNTILFSNEYFILFNRLL